MAKFGLPGISSKLPADVRQFLERMREFVTDATGTFITRRDLINAGIAAEDNRGDLHPGDVDSNSLLPPPAPTGVMAAGAMTNILVEWDEPIYRNHAYAEVWASGVDDLGQAVLTGTTPASVFAHPVGTGQTRYYWIRFVSKANITGPYNAVAGTLGLTSNDPAWLLEVLAAQITSDQLTVALNTRIGMIEDHQRLLRRLDQSIESAAVAALNAALKASSITATVSDAGITTNPDTGEVYIYGLEEYKGATDVRLSSAEVRLDGAEASINLKASTTYVDQAIASAVIDPSQVASLEDVYVRLSSAEVDIDGNAAAIALKSSQTEVNGINGRLVTAEGEIDVLQGQVVLKAGTATVNDIDTRLNEAEATLNTISAAEITQQVSSLRAVRASVDDQANTLLRGLLFANRELTVGALAQAKNELRAFTSDGLSAEATARLTLQTTVDDHTASIEQTAESIDGIEAAYWVKIDNNGNVTGFGLVSELLEGGAATSKFIASVDQFAIVAPDSSLPMWTMNTSYAVGKTVKISGDTSGKMLVCKIAGTSALSETPPSMAGAIGSLLVDGGVTWQIASKVPFYVLTTGATINGVALQPGVYIDGALIVNASINNAQIANSAVDSLKLADLSVVTAKIADATITAAKIGNAQIKTAHIQQAAITTAVIADAAITNAKIGNVIQSSNFNGARTSGLWTGSMISPGSVDVGVGTTGWALHKDGTATFSNAVVRGTVYATAGQFSGSLSGATITGATGNFSGTLSGANITGTTGVFSGRLAAGVLDASSFDSRPTAYSTPGNHTYTVPSDTGWQNLSLRFTIVGAGGGGGGGNGGDGGQPWGSGGGGGGAGATVDYVVSNVSAGASISLNVGSGGAGGGPYAAGSAGGASSIYGGSVVASGGGGGSRGANGTGTASGGSLGGQEGVVSTSNGLGTGGSGGSSLYGTGGAGSGWNATGGSGGIGAGGGGGGSSGFSPNDTAASGGSGGGGYVLVEVYDPNGVVLNGRYSQLVTWLDSAVGSVPAGAR